MLAGEIAAFNTSGSWWDDNGSKRKSGGPRLRPVSVTGGRRQRNAPAKPGRTRRYYFPGISPSPNLQGEVVQHSSRVESRHFDVKLPASSTTEGTDGSFEDHLEFRYVDFLETSAPTLNDIGVLTKDGEADVGEIAHFLNSADPRTRLDAFPMWVLAKQIIRLLLQMRVGLRDKEMEALRKLMQDAQDRMTHLHDQLVAEQKANAELRAQLTGDEQKLLEEEDRIKRQQLELFKLHAEIEREKKQISLRASQTTVQSQRIEELEKERLRLEAQHADLHAAELEAQQALSEHLRVSAKERKELEEAMASEVHQAELRRKIKPVIVGWSSVEKQYALAQLLAEQGLLATRGGSVDGVEDIDIADPELEVSFAEDAPAINSSDPNLSAAAQQELMDQLEEMKKAQLEHEHDLNEKDAELQRLNAELAAAQAEADRLAAEAAAAAVAEGAAGSAGDFGGRGGGAGGAGSGGTIDPGTAVPWTMVITREAEVFELRQDPEDPTHGKTVKMTKGETVRVYEEKLDDVGVPWVRTSHGWMRRDAGNNSSELYEMLQKQQAAGGASGAGGSGGDGNSGTAGAGGSSDGAATGSGSGSDQGNLKKSKSTKIRDTRSEKLLSMYSKGGKGTKGPRPMPVQNIIRLVDKMYEAKVGADEQDDRKKHRRESLPLFIQLFLIQEFGLKSIADKNLKALVSGVHKFSREEEVALGTPTAAAAAAAGGGGGAAASAAAASAAATPD